MRASVSLLPVAMVAVHHGVELAAGIGLPLEPLVGRRAAAAGWVTALSMNAAVAAAAADPPGSLKPYVLTATAAANGVWQALALQHYVDWPWRLRFGAPWISDAEGLPRTWLPVYNLALLGIGVGSALATARLRSRPATVAHLAGLATLPIQLASARRHQAWLAAPVAEARR